MTKRPTPAPQWATESGCIGKQLFTDLGLAREVAQRTNRSRNARVTPYRSRNARVTPYRCHKCDGWHVGNQNNK